MELGTQVKRQMKMEARDLRENCWATGDKQYGWNCRVYTEEAFRRNTIKGYIYYILHSVLDLIHASD
jgi:hypothetical protein